MMTANLVNSLLVQQKQKQKQENIEGNQYELEKISRSSEISSEMEDTLEDTRAETLSLDATGLEAVVTADPRYRLIGALKGSDQELILDLPVKYDFEKADLWLKMKFRIHPDLELRYNIRGTWFTLAQINKLYANNKPLEILGVDDKMHKITPSATLAQIQEWLGYSLSEHVYIAEVGSHSVQNARDIAEAKWRYWVDREVTQITTSESNIKAEFPYFHEFVIDRENSKKWISLFKGKFNFLQLVHSYEDVQVFNDLFKFIKEEAAALLSSNLKVYRGAQFNPSKFETLFYTYFKMKFKGVNKIALDSIYDELFKPGFRNKYGAYDTKMLSKHSTDQAGFLLLDIIMRYLVEIDVDSSSGGPQLYEIVGRVKDVMADGKIRGVLRGFMLSDEGRNAFFDRFRQGFFDSVYSDLSFTEKLSNLKGRVLEAEDAMDDFPAILIEILKGSQFEAIINGMNFGRVDTSDPRSNMGLNRYIKGQGSSLEFIEFLIFNSYISGIRNHLSASDRSFVDSITAIVTNDGFFAREVKNTADRGGITVAQKKDLANDLARDAFMVVLIELAKYQLSSYNTKLEDLRKVTLTATAPSFEPDVTLAAILNQMGWVMNMRKTSFPFREAGTEKTQFYQFMSGTSLKFPELYTLLYMCADKLNSQVIGKSQAVAQNDIDTYMSSGEFENEIRKIVQLIYDKEHIDNLNDDFYESVEKYFKDNLVKFLLPTVDGSGFEISFRESFNLLFKKLDSTGKNPIKLKVRNLPADIRVFEDGQWKKLRDIYPDISHELSDAYIVVHGMHDGVVINGLMKIENVRNELPDGIKEGYRDSSGKVYRNIFVSDAYGNYLYSRIDLKHFTVKPDGWQLLFANNVNGAQKSLYLCFGMTSGNQYLSFLFDTDIKFNAKTPFQEYLPEIKSKSRVRDQMIQIEFDDLNNLYGKDFDQNVAFRLYFDLLDASKATAPYINLYITKFFGILNGKLTDYSSFTSGLDIQKMNNHLKDLFRSSDGLFDWIELYRFVYRTSDGQSFDYGGEFKEWIDFVYLKITEYNGLNEEIIKEAQELKKLTPLDILGDREYFTDSEIRVGAVILASIQKLFGHATIRLILLGMMNVNDDVSFRVVSRPKTNDLFKIMDHVGFISSKSKWDRHPDRPYTRTSRNFDICFFGMLFLDSHIAFKKGPNEFSKRESSYIFPTGPILLPGQILSSKNPTHLSWLIACRWVEVYKNLHGSYRDIDKSRIFIETQQNLIRRFEELVIRQVLNDPDVPIYQKSSLISSLAVEIRNSFASTSFKRYKSEFYNFLDSSNSYGAYTFRNGYKLHLSLHDFEGLDIIRWGGAIDSLASDVNNLKIDLVNVNINNFINHFKEFVSDIGGRVEIFPLYLQPSAGYKGIYGNQEEHLFDSYSIDLRGPETSSNTEDNYRKSESLLKHIGYIMHAYPTVFVVKKAGSTWYTKEIINIFSFRGYLKKFEIYSITGGPGRIFKPEIYPYSNIFPDPDDPESSISFYDDFWDPSNLDSASSYYSQANAQWNNEIWLNTIGLETLRASSIFHSWYMNMIKTSNTQFARDLREILGL